MVGAALVASAAAVTGLGTFTYHVAYRPWSLTWGATDSEVATVLPGDDLVADADFTATRAVTIGGDPAGVWPWIAQIGHGRAGFYSHDWLDNCGVPSAERIVAEHQGLAVGDEVPLSRVAFAEVRALEPARLLVLAVGEAEAPWMSWTWHLDEQGEGRTRLVTRLRARLDNAPRRWLWETFEILMTRRHLLGIKRRAEDSSTG